MCVHDSLHLLRRSHACLKKMPQMAIRGCSHQAVPAIGCQSRGGWQAHPNSDRHKLRFCEIVCGDVTHFQACCTGQTQLFTGAMWYRSISKSYKP